MSENADQRGRYLGIGAGLDNSWDGISDAEEVAWGEDDETYAELQAESLAAADLDPDWPGHS